MNTTSTSTPPNYQALATIVSVFFFWGFIAAGNSIFIPFSKHYFQLDQFQSQLIDFAFYGAYYIGALTLFGIGAFGRGDLVGSWGYKRAIVYGLLLSVIGAVVMISAIQLNTFPGMLLGLFVVALGFSLQQTAANPFIISLGDPDTGTARVNLGGGINSFGTAIGPIVVGFALFGTTAAVSDAQIQGLSLSKVTLLYGGVGLLFLFSAALFFFSKKLPSGIIKGEAASNAKTFYLLLVLTLLLVAAFVPVFLTYRGTVTQSVLELETYRMQLLLMALASVVVVLLFGHQRAKRNPSAWGALQYPQVVLGMLGIFVYVGMEVSIVSNLGELLHQDAFGGFSSSEVAPFISMYWGSMMIGRWTGALSALGLNEKQRKVGMFVTPLIAFVLVLAIIAISGYSTKALYGYVVLIMVQILGFYISKDKPAQTLFVFSVLGLSAMLVGILTTGNTAVYAFMSGGLFCSIMWPAIFNLSLYNLGKYTPQASGFLVMMILGGAIIPPLQGKFADFLQASSETAGYGIHNSYWIPVLCFAYVGFFALRSRTWTMKCVE
ncbi:MAG: MFS transporter [Schleiferiaceae bacterium]|nr:MFS transporter [Schleiferiaceae bacterium]